MHADPQLERLIRASERFRIGLIAVLVIFLLAWILLVFGRTTLAMVSIWYRSETFAHGFVVIPIFLYLLWLQRDALAAVEPKAFLPAFLLIILTGAVWLIADRLRINSVTQFAMMAMVPLAVWAALGSETLKTLLFPLAFLFFAVPFGEFLVPPLMNWTADFATLAIKASGVPVFREGNLLTIPSGSWAIVEACSGVRYLIASFMVGCLFAYLSYRSPLRRAAFIAASLAVPIVANWVRAYMIVMLGHLTNNRLAVGADHLVYGWIFFGVVMVLLFWIGAKWREDDQPSPASERAMPIVTPATRSVRRPTWIALAGALLLTGLWPLLEAMHASADQPLISPTLAAVPGGAGWSAQADAGSNWRPDVSGATAELAQTFTNGGDRVRLFLAFFRDASPEAKAVTSTNQLVRTTNRLWTQVAAETVATVMIGGQPFDVRTTVVAGNGERLAVWQWYWVDGHATTSEFAAKIYEALAVLQGHGDPVAWVVAFTPTQGDLSQAHAKLQDFVAAMREPIDATLEAGARIR